MDYVNIIEISNSADTRILGDDNSIRKLYQPSRLKRGGEKKILSHPHIVSYQSSKKSQSFGFKIALSGWGEYIITPREFELYQQTS